MPSGPAPSPVILEGDHVRLVPLTRDHLASLCACGLDPDLWRWITHPVRTPDDMRRWVEQALAARDAGHALPFATLHRASPPVVGSTRFGAIDLVHRRLEIGWTWITRDWQRTCVNTEAKLLMLRYAFETLGCHRVELKTDALNARSRAAIARLGARQEGTLRKHMLTADGRHRDTVYFSIVDEEWPAVCQRLTDRLENAR